MVQKKTHNFLDLDLEDLRIDLIKSQP